MFDIHRAYGALNEFFGPVRSAHQMSPMMSGVVSESYYIKFQSAEWLLRVDNRSIAELDLDVRNMRIAQGHKVPVANRNCRIVSLKSNGSAMIREWVTEEGAPWTATGLGRVVRNMHSVQNVQPRWSRYSELRNSISVLRRTSSDNLLDSLVAEIEALDGWEWLNNFVANDGFLTHGDLKRENLLSVFGAPVLIDWDKSGSVSRLADLALCVFHFARESRRPILACSQFLGGYGNTSLLSVQLLDERMLALKVMSRVFILRDLVGSLSGCPRRYHYFRDDVLPKWSNYVRIEEHLIDSMIRMIGR